MKLPVAKSNQSNRPVLSPFVLNLLVATYLMALCNATFWGKIFHLFEKNLASGLMFAGAVWAIMLLLISLVAIRWAQKTVLVTLLIIAGITSFYMDSLGVIIDREMIQNAATTTVAESKHLITPDFLLHVAIYGVLPAVFVLWINIRRSSVWRGMAQWVLVAAGSAVLVAGLLFSDLKTYSSTLRNHRDLMASVQPFAPINGALQYAQMMLNTAKIVVTPTGLDAQKGSFLAKATKPVLMVLVAGETGRAQNWSLGGYARQTNPELAKRDILYYSKATSCGTATATSLPCMFSPLTKADYSFEGGLSTENLLDVLGRAGFRIEWWDNQTGDKAIAARFKPRFMVAEDAPESCQNGGECNDSVFLPRLADLAATMTQNTVVVLHQIGSHGPSYWLRYPPDREVFAPTCKTPELTNCSTEEIVNAYDNTIAYTDYFLSQVVDMLEGQDRVIPAMYYVSDHGESLGEDGIYLHGAPYFMAPDFQTRVPMVIWLSKRFGQAMGLDQACMAKRVAEDVSHDNLFSTVIGLLDVSTTARIDALDLAGPCRAQVGG